MSRNPGPEITHHLWDNFKIPAAIFIDLTQHPYGKLLLNKNLQLLFMVLYTFMHKMSDCLHLLQWFCCFLCLVLGHIIIIIAHLHSTIIKEASLWKNGHQHHLEENRTHFFKKQKTKKTTIFHYVTGLYVTLKIVATDNKMVLT